MIWALVLVVIWCGLGLLLTGIGLLIGRALDGRKVRLQVSHESFWLGWAGMLAILQPLQLFVPSGPKAFLAALPLSILGWILGLDRAPRDRRDRRLPVPWIFALALTLWLLGLAALKSPGLYDSYLYHLQAIRWATSYHDIAGLGNLNHRIGWACAHFPFVAALETGLGPLRGFHLANGLLVAAFSAGIWVRLRRSTWRGVRGLDPLDLVSAAAAFSVWKLVSSPDTDAPLTLLGLLIARTVVSPSTRRLAALPVLVCAGIAMKLSFAPFGALAIAATVLPRVRAKPAPVIRALLHGAPLCAVILAGWSARSAVLSGHLAFPLKATALPVEFRIPEDVVEDALRGIRGWPRDPSPDRYKEAMNDWRWVPGWFLRTLRDPAVLAAATASLGWTVAAFVRRRRSAPPTDRLSAAQKRLLATVLASLAIWFLSAPDPRFARPLFWTLLALGMAGGAGQLGLSRSKRALAAVACTGALAAYFLVRPGVFPALSPGTRPTPPLTFPVRRQALPSGLVVLVPVADDRCGDAPIPCTPYPDPRLRLRNPLRIEDGILQ